MKTAGYSNESAGLSLILSEMGGFGLVSNREAT